MKGKNKSLRKKNKSSLTKLGDSVAKTSQSAITTVNKKAEGKKVSKSPDSKNRRLFGLVSLTISVILIGLLSPSLWPLNKIIPKASSGDSGTYAEGFVGGMGNLNPIFADSPAEKTVSNLLFSSLLKKDTKGEIYGDLAKEWKSNDDSTVFTVTLKEDIEWSDGETLNADDVVKTYELIQHPDTESPLRNSWSDVKVQKKDDYTVTFSIADSYVPFLQSLTNQIIPEHAFAAINPSELRSDDFNQQPLISSGPYTFERFDVEDSIQVDLLKNDSYHGEKSTIKEFIVKTYPNINELITGFDSNEISAMPGVDPGQIQSNPRLSEIINSEKIVVMPQNTSIFVFLKNTEEPFKDKKVRNALYSAANTGEIADGIGEFAYPLTSPLLSTQYKFKADSPRQKFDLDKANKLLDDAGWKINKDTKIREKDGEELSFELLIQNNGVYPQTASILSSQWYKAGVKVDIKEIDPSTLQQNHISTHNYQAVMFGISTGSDPDVFSLWHSSQSGISGLNLSELKNDLIDELLESARTKSDKTQRVIKYSTFLETWNNLSPAVPLLQPGYLYIAKDYVDGVQQRELSSPEERLNDTHEWSIN